MEPNSVLLIFVLLVACAVLLALVIRMHRLVVRIVCGVLIIPLAMVSGMGVVNDYFGYYQTWTAVGADLTGSYSSFASTAGPHNTNNTTTTTQHSSDAQLHGTLESVDFAGARSGIDRNGLVYLPPQYDQPRYAHTRFPVLELVHGTPGSPSQWVIQLRVVDMIDQLISRHQLGPMVLAMPADYSGTQFEEGVNSGSAHDDTYLAQDVPADVMRRYRVTHDRSSWGIAGFSSGGYVAANLALRHPSDYGASGIMDGYFRPQDGEAAAALGNNPIAEAANDPLVEARALHPGVGPLPAFWVSAGSGNAIDIHGAESFVTAIRRVEQVPFEIEAHAHHTFYAWDSSLPHLLTWMWQQLAPPALRSQSPVTGISPTYTLHLPKRIGKPLDRTRVERNRLKAGRVGVRRALRHDKQERLDQWI